MENKILGSCFGCHAETLRAADSGSAVIKKSVMPEGSYPASSYGMNDETLKQVQGDGTLGVRDDSRGNKTMSFPIETLGDDGKKYNSHSKLDLESHRFFDNNGFTLIELLVVVLIIGILAAVAVPQYTKAVEKSRMTEAVNLVRTIANAHQVYYMATGQYLTEDDMELLDIEIPGTVDTSWSNGRVKTKDFIYAPNGHAEGRPAAALAIAQRVPLVDNVRGIYAIGIAQSNPDKFYCKIYNNASSIQRELCSQLNEKGTL